ncbi:MAG: hypothetical protein M3247_04415 [Thermoproteota archaeon]|nr:hypothetical protein [Acidobacteriota bacterium]MDQ3902886.1 hypothetical protein [Thermoproteota archaeon]
MELSDIYLTPRGHLRFFYKDDLIRLLSQEPDLMVGDLVALDNMHEFWFSLSIICNRLHEYFKHPRERRWSDNALYIDTQSYFLFCRQFMDDLTILLRLSLGKAIKDQMSYSFSELLKRRAIIFRDSEPMLVFLNQEESFFEKFIEIRDSIIHRGIKTKQKYVYLFPDVYYHSIARLGGKPLFNSIEDLRILLSDSMKRILALGCLCGDFSAAHLRERHNEVPLDTSIYIVLPANRTFDLLEAGESVMPLDVELYEGLAYFLGLPIKQN